MKNRWSDKDASRLKRSYGNERGAKLALRTYSSRLIGSEKELVLHGGGNTSVKGKYRNVFGEMRSAILVKASGHNLDGIEADGHVALDLENLQRLGKLKKLSDEDMVGELRRNLYDQNAATPSIEALLHAFIPKKYIDHTHADSILALTNRKNGRDLIRKALGKDVIVIDYIRPGFGLAKAAAKGFEASPNSRGMVLMNHGLVTWGDTARDSYSATIRLVSKAERYLNKKRGAALLGGKAALAKAKERYRKLAPMIRGALTIPVDGGMSIKCILKPVVTPGSLRFVNSKNGKKMAQTPPLTSDHIIRTKPWPAWIDKPDFNNPEKLKNQISKAINDFAKKYEKYVDRYAKKMGDNFNRFDSLPRVIFVPGIGAICAGRNASEAGIVRDITEQTIEVKAKIGAAYKGIGERHLFEMEYYGMQVAKLGDMKEPPLMRSVAIVTGAAGAIGAGICHELLKNGCHVAATDLKQSNLQSLVEELKLSFPGRIIGVPMNVTDTESIAEAFLGIAEEWGGIDLVIVNAGIAHVSPLVDMKPADFQKVQKVNVEGTLYVLAEAARLFETQGAGGDVVLISTKNVFAPGAKFGAYSATKAAAHQLARIASLEMAAIDVRVNMVAPDAVFSHGKRKSGLWAEVGPDRMKARGLSEHGLEEYYRKRNLLKEKITAEHVGKGVIFFATRQTPTTGATIPVDGGLPDATPR